MGNTPSFDRDTYERTLLESYIKVCIEELRNGHDSVKLGVAYKGTGFYLYFQFEAPPNRLPGLIPSGIHGSPDKARVYFNIPMLQEHTIADGVVTVDVPDDVFIRSGRGAVLTSGKLGVTLHSCFGGTLLLFDESTYPYLPYTVHMGPTNPRINPFQGRGEFYATPLRQELGLYVTEGIKAVRDGNSSAIKVGKGARGSLPFFFEFKSLHVTEGEDLKGPIRVYQSVPDEEGYQVNCVDSTLLTDIDFVSTQKGRIFGPSAIGVKLHACPCGVYLYYNESGGEYKTDSLGIGKSTMRKNQFDVNCEGRPGSHGM